MLQHPQASTIYCQLLPYANNVCFVHPAPDIDAAPDIGAESIHQSVIRLKALQVPNQYPLLQIWDCRSLYVLSSTQIEGP